MRARLAGRRERKRREVAERLSQTGRAELQHVRDQQSPVRGKWGFFPK